jgi:hypothetical protein
MALTQRIPKICFILLELCIFSIVFNHKLYSKVIPPNYQFQLKNLQEFYPQKNIGPLLKKYKSKIIKKWGQFTIHKFEIQHQRYHFYLFLQVDKNGSITDFYTKLPSYFLHNVFHQDIIDLHGAQKKYLLKKELAIYTWSKPEFSIIYSATCTVTCFPIFYTVIINKKPGGHISIYESLENKKLNIMNTFN